MDDFNFIKKPNTNVKWWFVKEDLEFKIAIGEIKEGEKMPSYVILTSTYGIDRNTSIKVYQNMESDGLVYLISGLGYHLKRGAYNKARKICYSKLYTLLEQLKHMTKRLNLSIDEVFDPLNKDIRELEAEL